MFTHLYDERKAADAAMYLLVCACAPMNSAKLNRLLYLAERESFQRCGEPLTGDQLVVFEESPVLFGTHQRLAGEVTGWEDRIANLANHEIEVRIPIARLSPDIYFSRSTRLSDAEIEILDAVWEKFGALNQTALTDYIHMHCSEWTDQNAMPSEVTHQRLFEALGYVGGEVEELLNRLGEIDRIKAAHSLRAA